MLCAAASPVKYERKAAQHQREAQARQPDLQQLRFPVALGRDADAVPAGKVDLRQQERRRDREQGGGGEQARGAGIGGWGHDGWAFQALDDTRAVGPSRATRGPVGPVPGAVTERRLRVR